MTMIAVEKNIPMPAARGGGTGGYKYPWRTMEVGDSFHVAANGAPLKKLQPVISQQAVSAGKRCGSKFSTRQDGDGVRVWRVA